jgi:hypothetical protein
MNFLLLILNPLLLLISCKTQESNMPEECLRLHHTVYNTFKNEAKLDFDLSENLWYQDSVSITQICGIRDIQTASIDTTFVETLLYRLIDMRKNWIYEYQNLSDTAIIVASYAKADSISFRLPGGWPFFKSKSKDTLSIDSLRFICDTTLRGAPSKKYTYIQKYNSSKIFVEAFTCCDRKGTRFQYDSMVGKAIGCPIVKKFMFNEDRTIVQRIREIEYLSNVFPDSIKRVFAAWKQNVLKYPVE